LLGIVKVCAGTEGTGAPWRKLENSN